MDIFDKSQYEDRVAIATGAGGILGSEIARSIAEYGIKVAILDIDEEAAQETVEQIQDNGGEAIAIKTDVLDLDSLKSAQEKVEEEFGTADILLNIAGGNHPDGNTDKEYLEQNDLDEEVKTFFDLTKEGMQFVFNLNFVGTILSSQVFTKSMVKSDIDNPVVLNISSMAAFEPMTKVFAYGGAKAGINNFTKWLAVHMSKVGIRVNAIAPGFFLTKQNRDLLLNEDGSRKPRAEKIVDHTPMGRFGEPEDLVGTVLWLLNEEASGFVNGTIIPIDGGFQAYSGV